MELGSIRSGERCERGILELRLLGDFRLHPSDVTLVVNMDMIGRLNTPAPSVLLEGAAISQHVIDSLAQAAHDNSDQEVLVSLEPFASDHVPFINAGLPTVLTIEGKDQLNTDECTPRDTLAGLQVPLAI
ncbi:UNVERIFIED_ORG: Zn-dependent M28 family amino/carboxypeptidase [Arthrobacter globiformis]|nr:Zn-dependent M28 family amino/carboxypeptidase [Arthrobacter globiformis]